MSLTLQMGADEVRCGIAVKQGRRSSSRGREVQEDTPDTMPPPPPDKGTDNVEQIRLLSSQRIRVKRSSLFSFCPFVPSANMECVTTRGAKQSRRVAESAFDIGKSPKVSKSEVRTEAEEGEKVSQGGRKGRSLRKSVTPPTKWVN